MADNTLTKLLQVVSTSESKDLRVSALRVLGTVATIGERRAARALMDVLQDADEDIRIAAIEAAGQLEVAETLELLEVFVRQGGVELESAVHAASLLGARGAKLMGKLMRETNPSVRSRIAAVLAKSNTGNALVVTAQGLLDHDPRVIESTARSLATEVPGYSPPQRHALAKFLIEALGIKKIPPKSEAALLRVLAALRDGKAEGLFWSRILPPHTLEVRATALQALGGNTPDTEKRLQALLTCAAEKDFQIVSAALMMLQKAPANAKNSRHWIKLLEAPDVATRRFAVERLNGIENGDVARALMEQMRHPDRALREMALKALLSFPAGHAAMLTDLLATDDLDRAWFLARALAPAAKALKTADRIKAFVQAAKHHEAEDRRAAPLLFFLREMDHAWTRGQLELKAQDLRKKKKYAPALSYYRLLAQDPACGEETRFELAATGLKQSSRDLAAENRGNDPPLQQFARLLQNPTFDLIGHITKAKWLATDELFYLGFHFTEQSHRAQEFGKQVLEIVVKRSPKSDQGKQAKRKLKSEGLA